MRDMTDQLGDVAASAGVDAGDRLATDAVTVQLSSRVRKGARRRRLLTAGLTCGVVLLGVGAVMALPQLMSPLVTDPATTEPSPVQKTDSLTVLEDGSMRVLTQAGDVVEVPAAGADGPRFSAATAETACAVDVTTLSPGWKPEFGDAFDLVTFARPLLLDATGYHVAAQGQRVAYTADESKPQLAFSVDVDPAIAPDVVMTMTSYVLAPTGAVAYYESQFESRPAVEYVGDKAEGTYTATLTTRPLEGGGECKGVASAAPLDLTGGVVRYLVVTAFLNDGHGHVNPIATHTSWVTFAKESA